MSEFELKKNREALEKKLQEAEENVTMLRAHLAELDGQPTITDENAAEKRGVEKFLGKFINQSRRLEEKITALEEKILDFEKREAEAKNKKEDDEIF